MPPFFRDLRGDVTDATNVDVAVFLRKAELGGEMLAHQIAVEERDRPAADFEKLGHKDVGNRGFACAGKTAEEDRQALLVARRETTA
jgi:hypothetical protein